MTPLLFGQVKWLGRELSLAVPHAAWFDWLADFTGLDVETHAAQPGRPTVLTVVDDRRILVDGHDERRFSNPEALKTWLFLTVSDVMTMRGGVLTFHATGLVVDGGVVLVTGPPWSGKSTWAFEALGRGIPVLGDDQVAVDADAGTVCALPRPLKRRVVDGRTVPTLSSHAIRARLDDEDIVLEPRRTAGLLSVDRMYPVHQIVHLARHAGPGVVRTVLSKSDSFRMVLDQLRGEPPFPTVGAATRLFGRLQNVRLSVGDLEVSHAMEVALTISGASVP